MRPQIFFVDLGSLDSKRNQWEIVPVFVASTRSANENISLTKIHIIKNEKTVPLSLVQESPWQDASRC